MMKVGMVGWRGMVGSVLMGRMKEENDFDMVESVFFTTSNVGGKAPNVGKAESVLKDAKSIDDLKKMDIILTCQGGDYTPVAARDGLESPPICAGKPAWTQACSQPDGLSSPLLQQLPASSQK